MGDVISIITVLLHMSHHLLNPKDGGFREFKDEGIYFKKQRLNKMKPDCNQESSPEYKNTQLKDLIFAQPGINLQS